MASLSPRTLALMHGPSFSGDGAGQLEALATDYERRLLKALEQTGVAIPAAI